MSCVRNKSTFFWRLEVSATLPHQWTTVPCFLVFVRITTNNSKNWHTHLGCDWTLLECLEGHTDGSDHCTVLWSEIVEAARMSKRDPKPVADCHWTVVRGEVLRITLRLALVWISKNDILISGNGIPIGSLQDKVLWTATTLFSWTPKQLTISYITFDLCIQWTSSLFYNEQPVSSVLTEEPSPSLLGPMADGLRPTSETSTKLVHTQLFDLTQRLIASRDFRFDKALTMYKLYWEYNVWFVYNVNPGQSLFSNSAPNTCKKKYDELENKYLPKTFGLLEDLTSTLDTLPVVENGFTYVIYIETVSNTPQGHIARHNDSTRLKYSSRHIVAAKNTAVPNNYSTFVDVRSPEKYTATVRWNADFLLITSYPALANLKSTAVNLGFTGVAK